MKILLLTPWFPNPENPTLGNFILRQFELIAAHHDVYLLAFSANRTAGKSVSCESTEKYGFKGWHITHRSGQGPLSWRYARKGRSLGLSLMEEESFFPELVHAQIAHQIGDLLHRIKKNRSIPIVSSEHWSGYLEERNENLRTAERFRKWLAIRSVDVLLPVTNQLGQAMKRSGFTAQDICIWRNPVNDRLFKPSPKKIFDFMHLSSLDANKRPLEIIRSFHELLKDHPNARLSIGGDGATEPLFALREELGISPKNLDIHGSMNYKEVAERMRSARCLVQFSRYENLPCTIGEALTAGLMIISSDVGGIRELVNEENGLLVPRDGHKALFQAMKSSMESPLIPKAFDLLKTKNLMDQIDAIYEEILRKRN